VRRVLAIVVCAVVALATPGGGAWASSGGGQRWVASYRFGDKAVSDAVAVTPDGSTVFVTGTTDQGESDSHFATLAYDASTGAQTWVATFLLATDHDQYGRGRAIAVSPDGSTVYVTGSTGCFRCYDPSLEGWATLAYDVATGDRLWSARFLAGTEPGSVAVSPDGSEVFVNGSINGGEGSETRAYYASDGDLAWAVSNDDRPVYARTALQVSPNGATVYAASTVTGDGFTCGSSGGYRTTAMRAVDGSTRWSSTFAFDAGRECGDASDIALSRDGSTVWVTGYGGQTQGDGGTFAAGTVAYDAHTGARLWDEQDARMHVTPGDISVYLAAAPDGSKVFAVGNYCDTAASPTCAQQPLVTAAYDGASGSRLWLSQFDGGGQGWPTGIAVSPDGTSVYESGSVNLPCSQPCAQAGYNGHLIAYGAETGGEEWVATYPENVPWGLAVSPDGGSVYEAGGFTGAASTTLAPGVGAAKPGRCVGTTCGYSLTGYNTHAGPGTFQDTDPSVRYDSWKNAFAKTAVGGAYRISDARGATATYRTTATTSFRWLTHQGPSAGRARVTIDGRASRTLDLYAAKPSARTVSFDGLAPKRHTVSVTVLGSKRPRSTGRWVAVDGFQARPTNRVTEESSSRIRFDEWAGRDVTKASGGSMRQSRSPDAKASLSFTGRAVTWITLSGRDYGRARVLIDGNAHVVDLYRPHKTRQTRLSYTGLGTGRHHLRISPLGKRNPVSRSAMIALDALVVGH
jgi:hypothetical protein